MSEGVGRLPRQAEASAPALPFGDRRLARRAAAGDERAFAAIYRRYHQDLYRYCLALLRDREDAEDALQATMVKALDALPGETREIELKPWLFRIAHNEAISLVRRRRPTAQLDPERAAPEDDPQERAVARERLRELAVDLDRLPERQRGALVMRELSGLGFEQIGAALDASPAAAKQAVYEARVALQEMSEGRELECRRVREVISAGDRRVLRGRRIRAHLRSCQGCRDFEAAIGERRAVLGALAPPLAAPAAVATLHSVLGAGGAAAGSGAAGVAGVAGIGSALGAGAAVKAGVAIVATAAIVGGAAEVSSVIDRDAAQQGGSAPAAPRPGATPAGQGSGAAPAGRGDGAANSPSPSAGGNAAGGHGTRAHGPQGAPGQQTAPGQTSTAGNSATAPGQTGSAGNSATAPGHTGSAGNSASAPGQSGTPPGQAAVTPGQSGSAGASSQASSTGQANSSAAGSQAAANGQLPGGGSATAPGQTGAAGNSAAAPGPN